MTVVEFLTRDSGDTLSLESVTFSVSLSALYRTTTLARPEGNPP
jgi:hypothetical protein